MAEWAGTTYGNGLMHRWLIAILRNVDIRIVYVFTAIFVIPPCLVFRKGARYIWHYFRRQWHYGFWKSIWKTYLNHYLFGEAVIDKFAMYAGKKLKTEIIGYDNYLKLQARPEGFVQMSAHIGNYEIAGYSLKADDKRFNALVYAGEKETVMENRKKMFSTTNIRLIPISEDLSHMYVLNEALSNGEVLSIPADRVFGSRKVLPATLLGGKVELPLGPFTIATMRNCKVLAVNVMKTSWTGYTIYVTPLEYDPTASRKEQIRQLSNNWIAEIERMLGMFPEQWYNFFEFWK